MTKQLGDGKLLSQLTKKTVIYDFRQNDLKNGGHGAPLSPIFHKLLKEKFKIKKAWFCKLRRNNKYNFYFGQQFFFRIRYWTWYVFN